MSLRVLAAAVCCLLTPAVVGHGRLVDPPSRSSAWRYGFDTPKNYDDTSLYCGGRQVQWNRNGGKCGVCGDPYQGPHSNEAGGKYATGTIVRHYQSGETIVIKVQITAAHKGYFEFRLCPNNVPHKRVTQGCMDTYLLQVTSGGKQVRVHGTGIYSIRVNLPFGVTCSHCVLQWKYNTGNSWGTDPVTGRGCLGCGAQEQFVNCADVIIKGRHIVTWTTPRHGGLTSLTSRGMSSTTTTPVRIVEPGQNTIINVVKTKPPGKPNGGFGCKAGGPWSGDESMDKWCRISCSSGYCPATHCRC